MFELINILDKITLYYCKKDIYLPIEFDYKNVCNKCPDYKDNCRHLKTIIISKNNKYNILNTIFKVKRICIYKNVGHCVMLENKSKITLAPLFSFIQDLRMGLIEKE